MNLEKLNARRFAEVTTHDTNPLSFGAFALYIGGAGNVKVTNSAGDVATFTAVPAGTVLNVHARIVWATGTTATAIVALA